MKTKQPFTRFTSYTDLTIEELRALEDLTATTSSYERNAVIRHEGELVGGVVYFLVEGWALTTANFAEGHKQILKIHLPGDLIGAPSIALERAAETITTVTSSIASRIPAQKLSRIFATLPRLAMLFFLAAQEERIVLMDRLTTVGRGSAKNRLSALLTYLHERVALLNSEGFPSFHLPLNQTQIGDLVGLHVVHVNRMLRALEQDGLILRLKKQIIILQAEALWELSGLPRRRLVKNIPWLPDALPDGSMPTFPTRTGPRR